eukprot:CAMPEP_0178727384 /NCGR_PEP_ID=MMETSP0699-20121125/27839_1 /TAXON_ID=265572 /ORGANISM="Extubocellulus spinifer, Strain CCMP396" /LENGTH=98 /DNA_ID=CAMNT_0020379103 /DNA_START=88 /DNA_END=384 /DNA_ORIENTATION=+
MTPSCAIVDICCMGRRGKGCSTSIPISSMPTSTYVVIAVVRTAETGEIPNPSRAKGSAKRYRNKSLLVILVYVGGIGEPSIRLQMPTTHSKSYNRLHI